MMPDAMAQVKVGLNSVLCPDWLSLELRWVALVLESLIGSRAVLVE